MCRKLYDISTPFSLVQNKDVIILAIRMLAIMMSAIRLIAMRMLSIRMLA